MSKILSPFPEWQVVDKSELKIMRDVILADGFFETAIVLVGGQTATIGRMMVAAFPQ